MIKYLDHSLGNNQTGNSLGMYQVRTGRYFTNTLSCGFVYFALPKGSVPQKRIR